MLPQLEPLMDQYLPIANDANAARDLLLSDVSTRREIRSAVLTLLGDMRAHFTIEESSNGVWATYIREHPGAEQQISAFRREHENLLVAATRLEQLVGRDEPDEPAWRGDVLQGMGELVDQFIDHERREDEWLAGVLTR